MSVSPWVLAGYTSSPAWLPFVFFAMAAAAGALALWILWKVVRSGPRPTRDVVLAVLLQGAGAVSAGAAYPHDPEVLWFTGAMVLLALGCSVRVRRHGTKGQFYAVAVGGCVAVLCFPFLAMALQ